jgi:RNA recognition motif-containing protein
MNEEELKKHMEKYGQVKFVSIPLKEGKAKGFGFVVFNDLKEANKALSEINSSSAKIMGNKIVVDWCLPKNIFLRSNFYFKKEKLIKYT